MATIADMISKTQNDRTTIAGRIAGKLRERNGIADQLSTMRGQHQVDPDKVEELRSRKLELDADLDSMQSDLRAKDAELLELRAEELADAKIAALANQSFPGAKPPGSQRDQNMTIRVTEPTTYSAERSKAGDRSYLLDLYRHQVLADPDAGARIRQHGVEMQTLREQEVQRAVSTSGVAGFVPPQYISDLFAEYLRAGRPVANLCTSVRLPETGMTAEIPRITTGSAATVQASQNGSIGNQDIDDTLLSVPVVTIAGYVDISRQALDRGVLIEEIILNDLAADYSAKLDAQVISGTGADGQALGILGTSGIASITYTDASPTLAELWPKLADAIGRITSSRYTGPTAIAMRPNVWTWITSILATDGRPFVGAGNPVNAVGMQNGVDYSLSSRTLLDVPVILDGNIPANLGAGTNETAIIVGDFRDAILLEENGGTPLQFRFDQPGSATLTSRLLAFGYSAFTAGRQPTAFSKIGGTGLVTPAL